MDSHQNWPHNEDKRKGFEKKKLELELLDVFLQRPLNLTSSLRRRLSLSGHVVGLCALF